MAPTPRKSPRCAVYMRLSRDAADQTSTQRQEADCRGLCKMKGYKVAGIYSDVGLSGYKNVDRPEFDRLRDDVRAGRLDVVMVWKLDRLSRKGMIEMAQILELFSQHRVALVSVTEQIDTSTPMGEAMIGVIASMAKQESQNISTRTKSAKALDASRGAPGGGGRRPFGYQRVRRADDGFDYVIDEAEAEVLHEMARRRLEGESVRALAADLNARGITSSEGNQWQSGRLSHTLRSPFHAGLRVHTTTDTDGVKNTTVTPGTWPAIFTSEQHEALVAARGHQYPTKVKSHLLSGVAVCTCGGAINCKTTQRYGRQYVCRVCAKVTIKAEHLEDAVSDAVAVVVDSPAVRSALGQREHQADADELTASIATDREALRQLTADHYVDSVITRDEFLAARGPLADRIEANEARLARLEADTHGVTADPAELWATGDLSARREVIGLLIERITLSPTTVRGRSKFDPDRVAIVWRY